MEVRGRVLPFSVPCGALCCWRSRGAGRVFVGGGRERCGGLVDLPDFCGAIFTRGDFEACGDGVGAVGTESRAHYFVVVLEGVEWLSCLGVPDFCGVVEACGDDAGAVGTESRAHYSAVEWEGVEDGDCSHGVGIRGVVGVVVCGVVGAVVRKKSDECDEGEEGEDAEEEYEGRG